jgi:hypothetical protein
MSWNTFNLYRNTKKNTRLTKLALESLSFAFKHQTTNAGLKTNFQL